MSDFSGKKYAVSLELRSFARRAIERRYHTINKSGARHQVVDKDGKKLWLHIKTASKRWIGIWRNDDGTWKGLDSADIVVVPTLNGTTMEIWAYPAKVVREAFERHRAHYLATHPGTKHVNPYFIPLDRPPSDKQSPGLAGCGELWEPEPQDDTMNRAGKGDGGPAAADAKRERIKQFAAAELGMPVNSIDVTITVRL